MLCTRSARSTSTLGATKLLGTLGGSTRMVLSDEYLAGRNHADANTIAQPTSRGPRIHHLPRSTIAQHSSKPCPDFWSSNSCIIASPSKSVVPDTPERDAETAGRHHRRQSDIVLS